MYTQYRGIHTYMLMDGYLEDVGMMCIILAWVNFESFVPSWCFGLNMWRCQVKPRYGHPSDPSRRWMWHNGLQLSWMATRMWDRRDLGLLPAFGPWRHLSIRVPLSRHMTVMNCQPCPRVKLNAEAWRIAAAELLSQLEVKALASTGFGIKHDWYHYTYCQCSCAPWTLKWALTSRAHRHGWIQLRAVKVEGDLPQICGIRKIIDKCNDSFTFLVQKGALVSRRSVHWLRTWKALPSATSEFWGEAPLEGCKFGLTCLLTWFCSWKQALRKMPLSFLFMCPQSRIRIQHALCGRSWSCDCAHAQIDPKMSAVACAASITAYTKTAICIIDCSQED